MRGQILSFGEIGQKDGSLVGGKALSLSKMAKAGINVPSGFVITTNVYNAGLNPEIERQILETFDGLDTERVAVRSSAVAEDSTSASWAGQLETYLNIDRAGLINAIKKCWDSVNSEHAVEYAKHNRVKDADRAVAVVIQKMVDSDVSGVMFTANPVTNNLDEIVIEAIYGLGELIVQGSVTPENYVINKITKKIISNSQNQQKRMLIYKDGKNTELSVPADKLEQPVLNNKDISDLVVAAEKIEKYYQLPQDIEWAIEDGKLYITQARPITTLDSGSTGINLEQEFLNQNGGDKVMRFEGDFMPFQLTIEWWHYIGPGYEEKSIKPVLSFFTPKRTTAFLSHDKYNGASKETFFDLVNGRLSLQRFKDEYEKFSSRLSERYDDYFLRKLKPNTEQDSYELFLKVYDDFHGLIIWTLFYEQLDEASVSEVLAGRDIDLKKVWEIVKLPVFSSFDTRRKEYMLSALNGKTTADYLRFAFSDYTFFADEKFVKNELAKYDVHQLESEIKQAKETTDAAKHKFDKFLDYSDEFTKTVVEVLGWVLFCRDERKDMINKTELLLFHIADQLFDFWKIDKRFLPYTGISDVLEGRDYMMSIKSDLPKRPNGYCVLYETDGTTLFGYDRLEEQITNLDDFILSQHKIKDGRTILGEIGSIGQASGRVRVIRKNTEFDSFEPGEVLVTGMTRPEFVPLMQKAAAIITDEGGITSHAAIVSRELNKPCIIGTRIATQVLKTGDKVEVDANNGVVRIL
ncbi:MAG TPA: PEP/pyruvate-binding domain-containing protein [Candidatus Saccharimonadales bacterium]|nr:PEP/pyruvate-binding domain-containing protein [Candidatus Saccharimonadales bacterium]